jgi:hypothetical protein
MVGSVPQSFLDPPIVRPTGSGDTRSPGCALQATHTGNSRGIAKQALTLTAIGDGPKYFTGSQAHRASRFGRAIDRHHTIPVDHPVIAHHITAVPRRQAEGLHPGREANRSRGSVQRVAAALNKLLLQNPPKTLNSTWILTRAPGCYSFIRKHIRSEVGGIDWDAVTCALEPKYQPLWTPQRKRKSKPYRDRREIALILNKYRNKLYVFVAPADAMDLRIGDKVAVALVRVAQAGNLLARTKLFELVRYTINEWIDSDRYISRWIGHEDEIREQVEACIRRYRYSGSFLRYLFRTLEYAARGIRPLYAGSLDDPMAPDARERKIDNVIHDPETNEIVPYRPRKVWSFDSESQLDG